MTNAVRVRLANAQGLDFSSVETESLSRRFGLFIMAKRLSARRTAYHPARCLGKDRQHRQPVGHTTVQVAPQRSAYGLARSVVHRVQAVSSWPETMCLDSRGFNSVDLAAFAVDIDRSCHAVGRSSAQRPCTRRRILDANGPGSSESSRRCTNVVESGLLVMKPEFR